MTFKIGDFAVCPGHGVGQVCDIEKRVHGGAEASFYIIKLVSNGMRVMIPTNNDTSIRKLVSPEEIEHVFHLLQNHDIRPDNSAWNRRYRDYMDKIKSGSLMEIADVLRSLFLLKNVKKLSFGEKKLLDQCKELLVQEISLSEGSGEKKISSRIDSCFQ